MIIITFIFLFSGCNNDSSVPTGNGSVSGSIEEPSITSLSGKISNWAYGFDYGVFSSGYTIKLRGGTNGYIAGTSLIDSTGNFSIVTLTQPSTSDLINLKNAIAQAGCTGSITISDEGLNLTSSIFLLFAYKPNGDFFGDVIYGSSTHERIYTYADRNATLNINVTCGSSNVKYSCSVKAGWNRLTSLKLSSSNPNYEYTNNVIQNATWFLLGN